MYRKPEASPQTIQLLCENINVLVFIKLHVSAQPGAVILILYRYTCQTRDKVDWIGLSREYKRCDIHYIYTINNIAQ